MNPENRVCKSLPLLLLAVPSPLLAEGSAELTTTQVVEARTVLNVDILDHTMETFTFTGTGSVSVTDPSGASMGSYASGDTVTPTQDGAYELTLSDDQSSWDITVNNATDSGGRLWSYAWRINAGSFSEAAAFNGSVYTVVDGGSASDTAVIELALDGLAGNLYTLLANSSGVSGENGRSAQNDGQSLSFEYPIYLSPPSDASYSFTAPAVSNSSYGSGDQACDQIAPGHSTGEFEVTANVDGNLHVVCDLNGDGRYDVTTDDDLHLLDSVAANSSTTLTWDGSDNAGAAVAPGVYDCVSIVTVGEFHYVGYDIETSYQGMRMFEVDASLNRTGLYMYWNDAAVQGGAVSMPDGQTGDESSGPNGLYSGSYSAAADANVNARAWGSFQSSSKGDQTFLDTYTFVDSDQSPPFTIEVVDGDLDSDGDGLTDVEEDCEHGTDPDLADSDGDGLSDSAELESGTDPRQADSDGDGLTDSEELDYGTDPTQADSDGGGASDGEELADGTDPNDPSDDLSDADSDGDGLSEREEARYGTDPDNADSDGDGLSDGEEVNEHGTDPLVADTDADGVADGPEVDHGCDPNNRDSDGDGISDGDEVNVYGTDPVNPDSDGDGVSDGVEVATGLDPNDPNNGAGGDTGEPCGPSDSKIGCATLGSAPKSSLLGLLGLVGLLSLRRRRR